MQKLLFLFTKRQTQADYHFIPYQYGCFSYSANADLTAMVNKGMLLETTSHFTKVDTTDYVKTLKEEDRMLLHELKFQFGNMTASVLMKHTYLHYPYWAINSKKAKELLSIEQFEKVNNSRPKSNKTVLFTIGYQGVSLEEYLNRLLMNDIKMLVDVRCNPLSMKFGFSKSQLQRCCRNLEIQYVHFPEVGIQSEQRRELNTQSDYDQLFAHYREKNLPRTTISQEKILNLLKEYKRIALTCFESNIYQCHRKHLAEAIAGLPSFEYEIKHI